MKSPKKAWSRQRGVDEFETSQAIFRDAAHAMIRAGSLRELSIRGLAAAVGASPMTIYRYYPDKEALIADVRQNAWKNFAKHLDLADRGASSTEQRFRRLCQAYLNFAVEHEHEFRLIFEPPTRTGRKEPENVEAWQILTGIVCDLAPGLDERAVLAHAFHTWSSIHGLAMLHLSYGLIFDSSVEDVMNAIAGSLILSIVGSPSAA